MAIVINGSGTITGISAGGLPDGTVTADDLASTLDLSGKTVTLAAGGTGYGKVLQVVQSSTTTNVTTSSSSEVDTNLSASITPSSASSKILVLVNQSGCRTNATDRRLTLRLKRDSTTIITFVSNAGFSNGGDVDVGSCSTSVLDSPNTTSSVTYKTVLASADNNASVAVQSGGNQPSPESTIVLMEIAG